MISAILKVNKKPSGHQQRMIHVVWGELKKNVSHEIGISVESLMSIHSFVKSCRCALLLSFAYLPTICIPLPPFRNFPDPEIEPASLVSPALADGLSITEPSGKHSDSRLDSKTGLDYTYKDINSSHVIHMIVDFIGHSYHIECNFFTMIFKYFLKDLSN